LRDLVHLRGQLAAVALLVACGVAVFTTLRSMHGFLSERQAAYYDSHRFGHVFASVRRAPETLRPRLLAIPGVAAVETRIVEDALVDVPGLKEPATGRLVALPDAGRPRLHDLHLRRGRMPDPAGRGEVVASDAFARANGLSPGDEVTALISGRRERLRIVGTAISPEFIYEVRGGGEILPDSRRFGVLWMRRAALAAALDMEGAFDDVVLRLAPGAREDDARLRLDRILAPYGSLGAYGRSAHVSHEFITSEIEETRVTSVFFPAVFLGTMAFLVHALLLRLVAVEREQIGTLKAFGFGDAAIARHYMGLALAPVAAGAAPGALLGVYLAGRMAELYARFFQFPDARYEPGPALPLVGIAVALAAATVGALAAVRRAVAVAPAVAMRPEAPERFRGGPLERSALFARAGPASRIIARNVSRRPWKALASVAGIAVALAIVTALLSLFDAIDALEDVQFRHAQREDLAVHLDGPRPGRAAAELGRLPGVTRVEPYRAVAARLRLGPRDERTALVGTPSDAALRRIVDARRRAHAPPATGLLLGGSLARNLDARPGDIVRVEVLEGGRPARDLPVAAVADQLLGGAAYLEIGALRRILGEGDAVSGAYLSVDTARLEDVQARLKSLPGTGGVEVRAVAVASFRATIAESFRISLVTATAFACVIVAGIVYNGARIALSERGRELASLRVLGFTRGETAAMLLGEQALLTLAAIAPGLAMGYGLCAVVAWRFASDLFRLPLVADPRTYALAAAIVVTASALSSLLVRRRVDRLDIVSVLKTRE